MKRFSVALGYLLLIPFWSFAQVEILEIMYDLEGSDADREWIEVYNAGTESVDLSLWRFAEGDTNHKLKAISGNGSLAPGTYAVIVDDELGFRTDNPGYSGLLLDSSFSLSNTGEILILRDGELIEKDSVLYSKEWGAVGDGSSLQKVGGEWVPAVPTPGEVNSSTVLPPDEEDPIPEEESNPESEPDTTEQAPPPVWIPEETISAYITERSIKGIVGSPITFEGRVLGTEDEPLEGARHLWVYGDGAHEEAAIGRHTYFFPGTYVVSLNVSSGEYTASDRVRVTIVPGDIVIKSTEVGSSGYIELSNNTSVEVNLKGWSLQVGKKVYVFPHDSFILPKAAVRFPAQITGLVLGAKDSARLVYPNGTIASEYTSTLMEESRVVEVEHVPVAPPPPQIVESVSVLPPKDFPEKVITPSTEPVALKIHEENTATSVSPVVLAGETQLGAVGALAIPETKQTKEEPLFWWLVAVALVATLASLAYITATDTTKQDIAAEYTIIEKE